MLNKIEIGKLYRSKYDGVVFVTGFRQDDPVGLVEFWFLGKPLEDDQILEGLTSYDRALQIWESV